jgi:hypothetical protein
MQKVEYDKFFEPKELPPLASMLRMDQLSELCDLPLEEARERIKANEEPVPDKLRIKIKLYVDRRRKAGCSEKAIRKAVQKKFNIAVF